jgi:hypothetical protein
MKRSSWLHGLRATLRNSGKPVARGRKPCSPLSRRARFEPLEDRTLLATLTVNSPLERLRARARLHPLPHRWN